MTRIDSRILPPDPGTYVLLLFTDRTLTWEIGRLGEHTLLAGWAAYVGSAHGPGGLRARVERHMRHPKTVHWHIDTLTTQLIVRSVWYRASTIRLECDWATSLASLPGVTRPVMGFGSSDCRCCTHLFALPDTLLRSAWESLGRPDRLPFDPWPA